MIARPTSETTVEHGTSYEQAIESIGRNGTATLTEEEIRYLEQEVSGKFDKHPAFAGVELKPLDISKVPESIALKIKNAGGRVSFFAIVRTSKDVPVHKHAADGEIYFGGKDGVVTVIDSHEKQVGQYNLVKNEFTAITAGEQHGVQSESGTTFFGVKYTIGK
jgi:hypothetical protein